MAITFPRPTTNNVPNLTRTNWERPSNLTATHGLRYRPNPVNLIPSNLRAQATLNIDRMRHRLKMVGADTIALATQVVKLKTFWDRPIDNLVIQSVGWDIAPVMLGNSVPGIIQPILPNMARSLVPTVNDFIRAPKLPTVPSTLAPMTTNVHPGNPDSTSIIQRSELNPIHGLTTPALACSVCNFGIVWARHFPTSYQVVRIRHGPE